MPTLLEPQSINPEVAFRARVKMLEERLAAVERALKLPVSLGAPGAGTGQEGSAAGDSANSRLWLKLNGVWKYVALT